MAATDIPMVVAVGSAQYRVGYNDALLDVEKMLEQRAELAQPGAPRWTFENAVRGVRDMLAAFHG